MPNTEKYTATDYNGIRTSYVLFRDANFVRISEETSRGWEDTELVSDNALCDFSDALCDFSDILEGLIHDGSRCKTLHVLASRIYSEIQNHTL